MVPVFWYNELDFSSERNDRSAQSYNASILLFLSLFFSLVLAFDPFYGEGTKRTRGTHRILHSSATLKK